MRTVHIYAIILILCSGCVCSKTEIPAEKVENNFTIYVTNQSSEISPVDIEVTIDGIRIANANFDFENGHHYSRFMCLLGKGTHHIVMISKKADIQSEEVFILDGEHLGVVVFEYDPKYQPKAIGFELLPGRQLRIM